MASAVTGCSLEEGERLRRTLGPGNEAVIWEEAQRFEEAANRQGGSTGLARDIFKGMARGVHTAFNRSHAVACALLTYRTAWLRQHHPSEYAAAQEAVAILARGWRPACCNPEDATGCWRPSG